MYMKWNHTYSKLLTSKNLFYVIYGLKICLDSLISLLQPGGQQFTPFALCHAQWNSWHLLKQNVNKIYDIS